MELAVHRPSLRIISIWAAATVRWSQTVISTPLSRRLVDAETAGPRTGNNIAIWIYEQVNASGGCAGSFDHNVVDGTDGTGAKGYETVVYDPAPCAQIAYNVVHDVCPSRALAAVLPLPMTTWSAILAE